MAQQPRLFGPLMTSMASLGPNRTPFDSSIASWFKIDQVAFKSLGIWPQSDILAGPRAPVRILPHSRASHLPHPPRNHCFAQHSHRILGMCAQFKVGGRSTGVPSLCLLLHLVHPSGWEPMRVRDCARRVIRGMWFVAVAQLMVHMDMLRGALISRHSI